MTTVIDWRILHLHGIMGLSGKTVLEVGCGDGRHTVELARLGAKVYALDARAENLEATVLRCSRENVDATPLLRDVELTFKQPIPKVEVVFDIGVLYHLQDPVRHLRNMSAVAQRGILLDTHYVKDPTTTYTSGGEDWPCTPFDEDPEKPREGMRKRSHRLPLATIKEILARSWTFVKVLSDRQERNGPRTTILANGKTHGA